MLVLDELAAVAAEKGLVLATLENARTIFTPNHDGLVPNMEYIMLDDGGGYSPVVVGKSKRNGETIKYNAILLISVDGTELMVSLTSIISTVMVLDDQNYSGDNWDGEAPCHAYYRYGKLTKSFDPHSPKYYDVDNDGNYRYLGYPVTSFKTGSTPVKYVLARFEEGKNRPIYDTLCKVRTAYFAEDWKNYPG